MKKSVKSPQEKEEVQQTMWETWFVASVIIILAFLFVGTLDNSINTYPNWIYYFSIACLNLSICLYYGFRTPRD